MLPWFSVSLPDQDPGKASESVTLFSDRSAQIEFHVFYCQRRDAAYARDTAAFPGHAFDFPLAFTEDLQPGGINYQVCDFPPGLGV